MCRLERLQAGRRTRGQSGHPYRRDMPELAPAAAAACGFDLQGASFTLTAGTGRMPEYPETRGG